MLCMRFVVVNVVDVVVVGVAAVTIAIGVLVMRKAQFLRKCDFKLFTVNDRWERKIFSNSFISNDDLEGKERKQQQRQHIIHLSRDHEAIWVLYVFEKIKC